MSGASTCLCYHFGPDGLSVAKKTVENFVARAIRLYEQAPGEAFASARLGLYVRRWGGFRRGCLKVVLHLKNGKFTKLADAVEGTRRTWAAEVNVAVVGFTPSFP